jgi:hypothetical protein
MPTGKGCRLIQRMAEGPKGTLGADQWGGYQTLTGHEAPGRCFWCGAEVRNRRFCTFIGPVESYLDPYTHKWRRDENRWEPRSTCDLQYWRHFWWTAAVEWCWERAGGKCQECGTVTPQELRRTHHIIPLNGTLRSMNILNRQENLLPLCAHHHALLHGPDIGAAVRRANAELLRQKQFILARLVPPQRR